MTSSRVLATKLGASRPERRRREQAAGGTTGTDSVAKALDGYTPCSLDLDHDNAASGKKLMTPAT